MKYHPDYPERFGFIDDARTWARRFFAWHNTEHYHSGLNLLTPACVHYGKADAVQRQRQTVMSAAFEACPKRFRAGLPLVKGAPAAVWINPPKHSENLA